MNIFMAFVVLRRFMNRTCHLFYKKFNRQILNNICSCYKRKRDRNHMRILKISWYYGLTSDGFLKISGEKN